MRGSRKVSSIEDQKGKREFRVEEASWEMGKRQEANVFGKL